jgi:hypothetical protein
MEPGVELLTVKTADFRRAGGAGLTIVIVKRFGDAICLVADTMISEEKGTGKADGIPGRLKMMTLNRNFTVAYAGHSDPALCAIREAHGTLRDHGPDAAMTGLCAATAMKDHDVEFIVACHRPHGELRRIWDGVISDPLTESAISQKGMVAKIEKRFKSTGDAAQDAKNYRLAFIETFLDRREYFEAGVGGFPLSVHAQADSHAYKGHHLSENWQPIVPVWGTTMIEDETDFLTDRGVELPPRPADRRYPRRHHAGRRSPAGEDGVCLCPAPGRRSGAAQASGS